MKAFYTLIAVVLGFVVSAQNNVEDGILLKVNNREVNASDFVNVYTKNANIIADEDKMSVDEYFELFKTYQLKLEAAFELDLDKDPAFLKEYQKYYKQLADNYIANGEVTETMVKETYQRFENEVKASHILISTKPNATSEQIEAAQEKAKELKAELENGADFRELAKKHSDDPSAKVNGGNIGWFRAFKMVYPFEDAVYNLNVNEISEPVKTQFGFHIIKKTGERKSIGKIKIAHIMVRAQQKDTTQTPQSRIEDIYEKVLAGDNFQDLAKQFSQDDNTAENGGVMPAFELGDINSPIFEEEAFSLTEDGQVSEPFKTRFGWHIIKRLGTEALESYEEKKDFLTKKIKTSERSKMLNNRIQEKIENQYNVSRNQDAVADLVDVINDDIFKSQWEIEDETNIPDEVFLQIDSTSFTLKDLANYIEKQQRAAKSKASKKAIVEELADKFVYGNLVEHHKKYLPELDPEFAASVNEYKNGLLLYEVMEREIWNPAKEDSIALKEFYNQNASKYKTEEAIEVEIASFSKKRAAKKFLKLVKSESDFSTKANASTDAIFQEKEVKKTTSPAISEDLELLNGISKIYKHNGRFLIYNIHEIKPVRQLEYNEVKGRVISDYQNQLEKEWVENLKAKFNLVVNEDELAKVKKKFE